MRACWIWTLDILSYVNSRQPSLCGCGFTHLALPTVVVAARSLVVHLPSTVKIFLFEQSYPDTVLKVYCEKSRYSSAKGAIIEAPKGVGYGEGVSSMLRFWHPLPTEGGWWLGRGLCPFPEIFWFLISKWCGFLHSEWYYLPFRALTHAKMVLLVFQN